MKLQRGVYPDFYKIKYYVIEEKHSNIFVGRKLELQMFWEGIFDLGTGSTDNWAIISHRKTGKTALLVHFYNLAFWEQEEVVPLYFSFTNEERAIRKVSDKMALTWLTQWLAFLQKTPEVLEIKNESQFKERLRQVENEKWREKLLNALEDYHHLKAGEEREEVIRAALDMLNTLERGFKMPCMVMLDEIQEMESGVLKDNQGNSVYCADKLFAIVTNPKIWLVATGSRVSMLCNKVIENPLANRVYKRRFFPLTQEDSFELVHKFMALQGFEGYSGIEKDVYNLVGGHPFYIISIFEKKSHYKSQKGREKSFRTKEELQEVFEFEAGEEKGIIYRFWKKHIAENAQKLNQDTGQEGLTLKILYYLVRSEKRGISPEELDEKFQVDNIQEVKKKMQQLIDADLAVKVFPGKIRGLNDRVFALILPNVYYEEITGEKSEQKRKEAFRKEIRALMKKEINPILEDRIRPVEAKIAKVSSRVVSLQGSVNVLQGKHLEEQVREAIKRGRIVLEKGYKLIGDLNSVNVQQPKEKDYQIDIVGYLEKEGKTKKREKVGLAIEVKNWEKKIYTGPAEHFLKACAQLKKLNKFTRLVTIYISRSGFSKPATKILRKHHVRLMELGDLEAYIQNQD